MKLRRNLQLVTFCSKQVGRALGQVTGLYITFFPGII